jgi:glutamyl-tRNA reductase
VNSERFFVLGATHHSAPIAVRERLVLSAAAEAALRARLTAEAAMEELAILSTCNRVEFYGVARDAGAADRIESAFCSQIGFDPGQFRQIRIRLEGAAAAQHLFEVAAGIDSQIIGENEIFGQVKEAYAAAQAQGSAGPWLNRIFQKAFQAAKHVRTNSAITAGQVSIATVGVDLAQNIFGAVRSTRIFLIGAGEIGEKTAKAFLSRGVESLTIASRSPERSLQLASALGAGTLPFEQRETRLADFDIVVCATAAPAAVLSQSAIAAAMRKRPARPLLFLDLALPRDVEAGSAAGAGNVFLYNLDDLAKIAEENRSARAAEAERSRSWLEGRAARLWQDLADRATAPRRNSPDAALPAPAAAPQSNHPS